MRGVDRKNSLRQPTLWDCTNDKQMSVSLSICERSIFGLTKNIMDSGVRSCSTRIERFGDFLCVQKPKRRRENGKGKMDKDG